MTGLRAVWLLLAPVALAGAVLTHGPMVGHTTEDSTRIWVRADGAASVSVRLSGGGEQFESAAVRLREEDNFCGTVVVEGLSASTAYTYEVRLDGEAVEAEVAQMMRTFPKAGEAGVVRIGFGHSIIGPGAQVVWDAVGLKAPDLFVLMGDNIYSNSTDPAKQRRMYLEYRADPHFRAFGAKTPVYAVWDDHDFGVNNSDRTQPGKEIGLRTFWEIWPNPPAETRPGNGIWSKFVVGRSEFYLLDVRYHRSPNADPDGPDKTMLGSEQLAWFQQALRESEAVFKFPVSGSSWNCGGVEAWNHPFLYEYDKILAGAREDRVEGMVLLGGDQHQCTINVRPRESWGGYDLHEWMAGRLWAGGKSRVNDIRGFGMITVDTTVEPATVRLEFLGYDGLPTKGKRLLYTTPGALRGMWDSPPGVLGTPPRSADGEIRHTTSGKVWDAMPVTQGEVLTLEDLRFKK